MSNKKDTISIVEIGDIYKKLKKENKKDEDKLKKLEAAYNVLSNEEKKEGYKKLR